MVAPPDQSLVIEIEAKAVELAWGAGEILQRHFGGPLDVEYKDKKKQDPVTSADKQTQAYLCEAISRWFPDHGIVGEEGPSDAEGPISDLLWILDPLDGTTNFLNGLPIYGVSIGVLHRGTPVAGALFVPWPGQRGGFVLHARRGGGASMDGKPIQIAGDDGPEANRPVALPASLGARFRARKDLRRRLGQVRITGSIVYELALTVCGAFQYVIIGGPRIWDVAAGALIVAEAGGTVLIKHGGRSRWEPATYIGPSWDNGTPTLKQIRTWMAPLIVGNARAAPFVAANLQDRTSLFAVARRLLRELGPKGHRTSA